MILVVRPDLGSDCVMIDWSTYLRCNRCYALAGMPCWSMRIEHGRRSVIKWPHQRRGKKKILSESST